MPPDTNLFAGVYKRLLPPYRARSYIQTQHGERGNVGVVRERGRTADDSVIKAELHPPHRVERRATVRPCTLLLMTWVPRTGRALIPVCTDVEACISVRAISHEYSRQCEIALRSNAAASVTMLVTRLKPCSRYGEHVDFYGSIHTHCVVVRQRTQHAAQNDLWGHVALRCHPSLR